MSSGNVEHSSGAVERIAEQIRAVAGAERSAVVFGEKTATRRQFTSPPPRQRRGRAPGRRPRPPPRGRGLCGNVLAGGCAILAVDTLGDPRIHQGHAKEGGITTAIGVPVFHEGRAFAVLMALSRADGGRFSAVEEAALAGYAERIADELWAEAPPG